MSAPVAPRKKGTLTSSSNARPPARTSRSTAATATATSTAADDLATRLEAVSLTATATGNNSRARGTPRVDATSTTSRNLTRRTVSAKEQASTALPAPSASAASSSKRTASSSRTASDHSLEGATRTINRVLGSLKAARRSTNPSLSRGVAPTTGPPSSSSSSSSSRSTSAASNVTRTSAASGKFQTEFGEGRQALRVLRELSRGLESKKRLDIEKAALILIGYAIQEKEFSLAIKEITACRASLLAVCCATSELESQSLANLFDDSCSIRQDDDNDSKKRVHEEHQLRPSIQAATSHNPNPATARSTATRGASAGVWEEWTELLRIPNIVPSPILPADEAYPSILALQYHVISCLVGATPETPNRQHIVQKLSAALTGEGGPLQIASAAKTHTESSSKRVEATMTSIYSTITDFCSKADASEHCPADELLSLKLHALQCLIHNSSYFAAEPATDNAGEGKAVADLPPEDKAMTSLATQFHRALVLHGKALSAAQVREEDLAALIAERVLDFFAKIQESIPHCAARIAKNVQWQNLLNFLKKLAIKGDSLSLLAGVEGLAAAQSQGPVTHSSEVVSSCTTSQAWTASAHITSSDISSASFASICTKLSKESIMVELWIKSGYSVDRRTFHKSEIEYCLSCFARWSPLSGTQSSSDDSDLRRTAAKAVERLRYYVARPLKDKPSDMAAEVADLLASLLEATITISEGAIDSSINQLLLPSAIESCTILARRAFKVEANGTYRQTLAHLQRAASLTVIQAECAITQDQSEDASIRLDEYFECVKCVSSLSHAYGSRVYNHGRHASAIPFLQNSCELAEEALKKTPIGNSEHYQQLKSTLYRKWELLASAYLHIRDMQEALLALKSSLRASLACTVDPAIEPSSPGTGIDESFGKTVEKYTRVALFDLLKTPEQANLLHTLGEEACHALPLSLKGKLVELQVQALDSHLHKEGALDAVSHWLKLAVEMYDVLGYEADLVRILLRQMSISATVTGTLTAEEMASSAATIARLCSDEGLLGAQPDTTLHKYAAQYKALARLYVALDLVRTKDPLASKTLAKEAKAAVNLMKIQLAQHTSQPLAASPKSATSPSHATRTTAGLNAGLDSVKARADARLTTNARVSRASTQPSTASRSTRARSARTAAEPTRKALSPKNPTAVAKNTVHTTPPKKTSRTPVTALRTLPLSPKVDTTGDVSKLMLHDRKGTVQILSTTASILGVFGHTFLRISYLRMLRRVHDSYCDAEGYVASSTALAAEYVQLGKYKRAFEVLSDAERRAKDHPITPRGRCAMLLQKANLESLTGSLESSIASYLQAAALEEGDALELVGGATQRIIARTELLLMTAVAARTFSTIQFRSEQDNHALSAALQSLRLLSRATTNLARLSSGSANGSSTDQSPSDQLLEKNEPNSTGRPDQALSDQAKKTGVITHGQHAHLGWDLAQNLMESLHWISSLYAARGSHKSAAYFLEQEVALAQELRAPRLQAKITVKEIDFYTALDDSQSVQDRLASLSKYAAEDGGLSQIEMMRFKARAKVDCLDFEGAEHDYASASISLEKLDKAYNDTEMQFARKQASRTSLAHTISSAADFMLPDLQARIIHPHAWLLCLTNRHHLAASLLSRVSSMAVNKASRFEATALKAKILLHDSMARMRSDPVMGLLHESVLSVPCLSESAMNEVSANCQKSNQLLAEVELAFLEALSFRSACHNLHRCRETISLLTSLQVLRTTLDQRSAAPSTTIVNLLNTSTAITLRREMLASLHDRLYTPPTRDDLKWRDFAEAATSVSAAANWKTMYERYSREDALGLTDALPADLPEEWVVLSLHLAADRQSLVAVRRQAKEPPLILQLPLDRLGHREGEEELLNFWAASTEMMDIIAGANETAQRAKHCVTQEARAAWWKERKSLDRRLAELLVNIETRWFGAFIEPLIQTASATRSNRPSPALQAKLEQALRRTILTTKDNKNTSSVLDERLMSSFWSLRSKATDEDIEDLLHFVIDSFQFSGVHIASDEIDIDQGVVDIRAVLDDYWETKPTVEPMQEDHLFLILDSALHPFPWEAMPCLAGRSVSRLPSLSFLQDRLDLRASRLSKGSSAASYPGMTLDLSKTYYVLNPSGDLKHTQKEFESWANGEGWDGVSGRAPMEEELKAALSKHDIFLYFGHGGAEQYIRTNAIRNLPQCATTFLWGCSSGYMCEQGEFEATGTPWTYMIGGAPAVVANLWDVTDKDIDRLTKAAFERFGLGDSPSNVALPLALAEARVACSLKFLNGAAPVVWGIPVKLTA